MVFEVTAVSRKEDGSTHVVMHGVVQGKAGFRGPTANSIISIWPSNTALPLFAEGKKFELKEWTAPVEPVSPTPEAENVSV